jgi:hypothetical protein
LVFTATFCAEADPAKARSEMIASVKKRFISKSQLNDNFSLLNIAYKCNGSFPGESRFETFSDNKIRLVQQLIQILHDALPQHAIFIFSDTFFNANATFGGFYLTFMQLLYFAYA